jgi:hypothetical protein
VVVAHTGQKCEQSGIYKPSCDDKQIALSKGDTFPPCGQHGNVSWSLVTATV